MVGNLVPLKGGIGGIFDPPIGRKYATYIPLIVLAFWGVICYLPSFTGTISTTIDLRVSPPLKKYSLNSWPYMDEQLITFQKMRKHIPPFMGSSFSNRLKKCAERLGGDGDWTVFGSVEV